MYATSYLLIKESVLVYKYVKAFCDWGNKEFHPDWTNLVDGTFTKSVFTQYLACGRIFSHLLQLLRFFCVYHHQISISGNFILLV